MGHIVAQNISIDFVPNARKKRRLVDTPSYLTPHTISGVRARCGPFRLIFNKLTTESLPPTARQFASHNKHVSGIVINSARVALAVRSARAQNAAHRTNMCGVLCSVLCARLGSIISLAKHISAKARARAKWRP